MPAGAVSTKLEKADLMIMTSHYNMHFQHRCSVSLSITINLQNIFTIPA